MNNLILRRLIWKEYRLMRSFWIAMALLAVFLQLIARSSIWSSSDSLQMIFAVALVLPAFYAMGCGATLFATEHETGTYQFQRSLPVSGLRLFFGKIPFGLISTPLLFLLLWVSAWMIGGMRLPDSDFHVGLWGLCGVAALELFLWGVLFSLLSDQPMKAAILAAIAGTTTIHVIAMIGESQWRPEIYLELHTIPYRLAVACILAVVNVPLACRWLRDGSAAAGQGRRLGRRSIGRRVADVHRGKVATQSTILGRLAWQQWRQSSRMIVVLVAMTVPLLLFTVVHWNVFLLGLGNNSFRTAVNLPLWIAMALAAAPLAGASVFMADQRGRSFRFLTERGVSPRQVWIGRHAIWILTVASWAILLVLPWMIFPVMSWMFRELFSWDHGNESLPQAAVGFAVLSGGCFAYVAGAYAVGQLCSMFFRSSILAGFFALLLSAGLVAWSVLMLMLGVPGIWSIAPIPLILLVATWLRTPNWLREQNGIKGWRATASWLTITFGLLLIAVPTYRVYEIPLMAPGFSPAEFSREAGAEARNTAKMYLREGEQVVPMAKRKNTTEEETKEQFRARQKAWIDANQEVIATTMVLTRATECDDLEPPGRERLGEYGYRLAGLLLGEARWLEDEGDLDAGLELCLATLRMSRHIRPRNRFPREADHIESSVYNHLEYWAAKPGQTPERIRTAIKAVERQISQPPSQSDKIKADYLVARRIVEGDIDLLTNRGGNSSRQTTAIRSIVALQWMPWERARTIRLLNQWTAQQLLSLENVERAVADGMQLPITNRFRYRNHLRYGRSRLTGWNQTAAILERFHDLDWYWQARMSVDAATQRRATCLLLALTAWKLEHGELPDTLDDLVGPYLTKLPPDPHTGEPFRYFPQGIPIAIMETNAVDDEPIELLSAGQPFIWSTGWQISIATHADDRALCKYFISGDLGNPFQQAKSEYEIWRRGKYFTLP